MNASIILKEGLAYLEMIGTLLKNKGADLPNYDILLMQYGNINKIKNMIETGDIDELLFKSCLKYARMVENVASSSEKERIWLKHLGVSEPAWKVLYRSKFVRPEQYWGGVTIIDYYDCNDLYGRTRIVHHIEGGYEPFERFYSSKKLNKRQFKALAERAYSADPLVKVGPCVEIHHVPKITVYEYKGILHQEKEQ